jgi:hypothetical protein
MADFVVVANGRRWCAMMGVVFAVAGSRRLGSSGMVG